MTTSATNAPTALNLDDAIARLRTPEGAVLTASAGIGLVMAAHWTPLVLVMAPMFLVTLLLPVVARTSSVWLGLAVVWAVAVVLRRSAMEDHVYLYLAWLVAVGVGLLGPPANFLDEVRRSGRRLIAVVFGVATLWKLISGTFLSGATLWITGMLDERMTPMMRTSGISQESFDRARPEVLAVLRGERESFDIGLSSYSSVALVAISLATVAIEAAIAVVHLVPDTNRFARLRVPLLVLFGIATYAVVPVLPFALLLSLIGIVVARFDRRAIIAFAVMVTITIVRFLTL